MDKKEPTTTKDYTHEARPEHKVLTDDKFAWAKDAPEGEKRSAIVIQAVAKDGKVHTSSHIYGNTEHLRQAAKACMSAPNPDDNPAGIILLLAAIDSLIKIGALQPLDKALRPEQTEDETHNNKKNE